MRHELQKLIVGPQTATRAEISALLARLSLHYWRPDFTPQQAAMVVDDFIRDLAGVTAAELAEACDAYRCDPKNRFFPTPGQLLKLLQEQISNRERTRRGASRALKMLNGGLDHETDAADREGGPRDFAALRAVLMAGKGPSAEETSAPAQPETFENTAELRAALARRRERVA